MKMPRLRRLRKSDIQFVVMLLILTSPFLLLIIGKVEWFWYAVVPLGLMLVYSIVTHLGPLGIVYLRMRRLRHSIVEEARQEWAYDMHTYFGRLTDMADKWDFARQPYGLLVYEMAAGMFYDIPKTVHDARYREWFGAEAYSLFHVIVEFDNDNSFLHETLDRMMAANIQDYATFYGYCDAAGVEAALIAFEHDLPIDYAKAMAE